MSIVNTFTLKSNRQIKINFDGGDLSSDAGLLLIKEFAAKIGFTKLIKKKFKTNDKSVRFHKDNENLMQMIYQIISAYFEDDCADQLTLDPVFNAILEKNSLASQPTLSKFFNRIFIMCARYRSFSKVNATNSFFDRYSMNGFLSAENLVSGSPTARAITSCNQNYYEDLWYVGIT